jgi:pantoate--beta-alanine ligase
MTATPATARSLARFDSIDGIRAAVLRAKARGERVGFVPTMGALHAGHLSLIEAARRETGFVVVSIFVNPTQFGPGEDFRTYPRTFETDLELCRKAGVDALFHPAVESVYPPGFTTFVEVAGLSGVLEGEFRPGHFRGVTTVVLKLFQMVPADVAYFGQKDYQQQTLIRRMCAELDVPIEIRVCPTVREPDGLALSSRNVYLNAQERKNALALSQCLHMARELVRSGESDLGKIRAQMLKQLSATPQVRADYATLVHPETLEELEALPAATAAGSPRVAALVAARVGTTRLIDNLIIEC